MHFISLSPTNFALLQDNKMQLHTKAPILKKALVMSEVWMTGES